MVAVVVVAVATVRQEAMAVGMVVLQAAMPATRAAAMVHTAEPVADTPVTHLKAMEAKAATGAKAQAQAINEFARREPHASLLGHLVSSRTCTFSTSAHCSWPFSPYFSRSALHFSKFLSVTSWYTSLT